MRLIAVLAAAAAIAVLVTPARAGTAKHSQRYETAVKINRGLARLCASGAGGCSLKGQGFVIEDVGYREHVHPAFMVAASFTESSGGDAACGPTRKNIWGLNACAGGFFIHGPVPAFGTWREAFTYFARFVKERWPGASSPYLSGYCGCGTTAWGNRTSSFMYRMGFVARLRYP